MEETRVFLDGRDREMPATHDTSCYHDMSNLNLHVGGVTDPVPIKSLVCITCCQLLQRHLLPSVTIIVACFNMKLGTRGKNVTEMVCFHHSLSAKQPSSNQLVTASKPAGQDIDTQLYAPALDAINKACLSWICACLTTAFNLVTMPSTRRGLSAASCIQITWSMASIPPMLTAWQDATQGILDGSQTWALSKILPSVQPCKVWGCKPLGMQTFGDASLWGDMSDCTPCPVHLCPVNRCPVKSLSSDLFPNQVILFKSNLHPSEIFLPQWNHLVQMKSFHGLDHSNQLRTCNLHRCHVPGIQSWQSVTVAYILTKKISFSHPNQPISVCVRIADYSPFLSGSAFQSTQSSGGDQRDWLRKSNCDVLIRRLCVLLLPIEPRYQPECNPGQDPQDAEYYPV